MRILVTGSRDWTDEERIRRILQGLPPGWSRVTLVSGNCPTGADWFCEQIALEMCWVLELHPADWNQFGKRAGFIRNAEMVASGADVCIAFIRNNSKGATMTLELARKAGIRCIEERE